jgi:hypothetical protein
MLGMGVGIVVGVGVGISLCRKSLAGQFCVLPTSSAFGRACYVASRREILNGGVSALFFQS